MEPVKKCEECIHSRNLDLIAGDFDLMLCMLNKERPRSVSKTGPTCTDYCNQNDMFDTTWY